MYTHRLKWAVLSLLLFVLFLYSASIFSAFAQHDPAEPAGNSESNSESNTLYLPFVSAQKEADQAAPAAAKTPELVTHQRLSTTPRILIRADPSTSSLRVPRPTGLGTDALVQAAAATFQINYNPAGCAGTVTPWPTNAQTAFSFAAGIWAGLLNAGQTIEIDACWRSDLGNGVLGSAGAYDLYRDFTNAPVSGTWYPVALANTFANTDLNGGDPEIIANFSSSFANWYFGIDGNTPASNYDFASVVLHEMGHGLGFFGSMNVSGSAGQWGFGTVYPAIYDRFTEDGNGLALLSYTNNSTALGNALRGNNNGVFFDGPNANSGNGGNRVRLYSPSSWNQGSSYSHLDEVFNNSANALMTFSLSQGESIQNPGSVTLGLFRDMGWTTGVLPTPTPTSPPTATATPLPNCAIYSSSNVPVTIVDLTTVTSVLNVPMNRTLTDVNIRSLTILHTWDSDLVIDLVNPAGTAVTLFNQRGNDGDNLVGTHFDDAASTAIGAGTPPFTGRYRPDEPLSTFNGSAAQGQWQLQISDLANQDSGTLQAWSLELCGSTVATPTPTPTPTPGSPTTPGDGNGDGVVNAGDITACVLEIFDGDGTVPGNAPGGTFPGTAGCDANQDAAIDAGDISCTVLLIFNGQGACVATTASDATTFPISATPAHPPRGG